ncbi:D-alanyl-D-alanine carboxypeptidase (penicillin-binding protein 5/6) [Paenibacillus uliginis N3/975]|uniref:D-alanyl-D-alanine carboxypeptidase (Penicillin-binding protein 5/6) n=1 Tax=Paenibacillus uliginis N3/975 TaxID=1313296 RepID=A0A1X7HUT9_9BACL|nr:D-alanyl-D-alanine carboxypeptidase family protein [Paenibacillus uliginis]SMF92838.1 D-alanyl-D-alanine carboxypeptidase (penicillin-binding protein 5/6) [Paenibacillus uliginis N3/975]
MKKRWLWYVMGVLIMIPIGLVIAANTERVGIKPEVEAKAVVLMDLNTGRILFSQNGDVPLPPASMSKLMTELIILDKIKDGTHSWDEMVRISEYASNVGGVRLSLNEGEELTVRELFQSMALYSANDAAVALAEHFAGSEGDFVRQMNLKAKELQLSNQTCFVNASGLENGDKGSDRKLDLRGETRMTAADTAKLAAHLINSHPDILNTSSKTQMKLKGRDLYLSTTNWMLPSLAGPYSYEGTDGLKTGYTENAGYCFTGTAEKGGSRLIAVVLGTKSKEARFVETRKLFDYGFSKTLTLKERLNDWFHERVPSAAFSSLNWIDKLF